MEHWLWIILAALFLRLLAGDKISPVEHEVSRREGESVTLTCRYETNRRNVYLYWFRHHSDLQPPQFILWKGARDKTSENIPDKRFQSQTSQTESEVTIGNLTLADTSLYYCALEVRYGPAGWFRAFVFGDGIRLNVLPKDLSPVAPTLFALSPLQPEESSPRHDNDVCLAANFYPKEGEMVLNAKDDRVNMSTSGAVLSYKQKTFFYVGFLNRTIYSCELHNASTNNNNNAEPCADLHPENSLQNLLHQPAEPCADLHPENSLQNLLLLQMNMLRVMFTKTVALSTIITIRALLI